MDTTVYMYEYVANCEYSQQYWSTVLSLHVTVWVPHVLQVLVTCTVASLSFPLARITKRLSHQLSESAALDSFVLPQSIFYVGFHHLEAKTTATHLVEK